MLYNKCCVIEQIPYYSWMAAGLKRALSSPTTLFVKLAVFYIYSEVRDTCGTTIKVFHGLIQRRLMKFLVFPG